MLSPQLEPWKVWNTFLGKDSLNFQTNKLSIALGTTEIMVVQVDQLSALMLGLEIEVNLY